MKNKLYIITAIILLTIGITSCTDIITLDLENVDKRIIIEATLDATDSTCIVSATCTNNFYDTTKNKIAPNLTVILYGPNNAEYELTQDYTRKYTADNIDISRGDEFTIKVIDSTGTEYIATATTPGNTGQFLTFFTSFSGGGPPPVVDSAGNERKRLIGLTYWLDIPDEENYYRIKIHKNGEYMNQSYNFVDDKTSFSDTMQLGLSEMFVEFDTVNIELLTINKATYDFYQELIDVQNSGMNSTTPYNPKGNFSNEAIGYFCIQTSVKQEFIVFELPF